MCVCVSVCLNSGKLTWDLGWFSLFFWQVENKDRTCIFWKYDYSEHGPCCGSHLRNFPWTFCYYFYSEPFYLNPLLPLSIQANLRIQSVWKLQTTKLLFKSTEGVSRSIYCWCGWGGINLKLHGMLSKKKKKKKKKSKKKKKNTAKDTKTLLCEILATSKYMLSSESVLCYVTIQWCEVKACLKMSL